MYSFKTPECLYLLLCIPFLIYYYHRMRAKKSSSVKYSNLNIFKRLPSSAWLFLRHIPAYLRFLGLVFLILALARPQQGKKNTIIKSEGIEIALLIDISGSMKGEDLKPNRLFAAKRVIADFVKKRTTDRQGLIIYGSQAFLQCPLTLDHSVLLDFLEKINFIAELGQNTAIGTAMATGIKALKKSKTKSKVMILLTDGANNAGELDPITAAELANTYDIKIYTIGIGKPGVSKVPITTEHPFFGRQVQFINNDMDEPLLKEIAKITGGQYFNAQDIDKLDAIYKQIDKYEKTEINSTQYLEYDEQFLMFVLIALALLALELILKMTRFRTIP